jgi:hypothetical protein
MPCAQAGAVANEARSAIPAMVQLDRNLLEIATVTILSYSDGDPNIPDFISKIRDDPSVFYVSAHTLTVGVMLLASKTQK